MLHQGRQGQDVCLVLKGLQGAQVDSARCRAQSPQHAGREAVEGDAAGQASKETNKQGNKETTERRADEARCEWPGR